MPDRTVFIVDDDAAIRHSVGMLLDAELIRNEGYASAQEFLNIWNPARKGVLLADIRMPDMNGLELLDILNRRKTPLPTIMITGHADVPIAVRAMKAGAIDFLEKPVDPKHLINVLRNALESGDSLNSPNPEAGSRFEDLTNRERDILHGLMRGEQNKEIASRLGISPRTVEVHRARVMQKTSAESLSELIRLAITADIQFDRSADTKGD